MNATRFVPLVCLALAASFAAGGALAGGDTLECPQLDAVDGIPDPCETSCEDLPALQRDDLCGDLKTGGKCNGLVDVNCEYCSHQGSNSGSDWSKCDDGSSGYYWTGCTVWAGYCEVG